MILINWQKSQRRKLNENQLDKCTHQGFRFRLHSVWQLLRKYILISSELQVWQSCDRQGNIWWSAYDPITQRGIYHVSQERILAWIEGRDRL